MQQPQPSGGWIKLHRSMKDNGHLQMPDKALKVWLYCLLQVNHKPGAGCQPGEGWISYDMIRDGCCQPEGPQWNNTRISNALGYLEQNGYIQRVKTRKGAGMKIRIINWDRYQSETSTTVGLEMVPDMVLGLVQKQEGLRMTRREEEEEEEMGAFQFKEIPDHLKENWTLAYQHLYVRDIPSRNLVEFEKFRQAGVTDRLIVHLIERGYRQKRRNVLEWAATCLADCAAYGLATVADYEAFESQRDDEDKATRAERKADKRPVAVATNSPTDGSVYDDIDRLKPGGLQ